MAALNKAATRQGG